MKGVIFTSDEATDSAKKILLLQQRYTEMLKGLDKSNGHYTELLNKLFENPLVSKTEVAALLNVSTGTAGSIVENFVQYGILQDASPDKQRYKKYLFREYFDILRRGTDL